MNFADNFLEVYTGPLQYSRASRRKSHGGGRAAIQQQLWR